VYPSGGNVSRLGCGTPGGYPAQPQETSGQSVPSVQERVQSRARGVPGGWQRPHGLQRRVTSNGRRGVPVPRGVPGVHGDLCSRIPHCTNTSRLNREEEDVIERHMRKGHLFCLPLPCVGLHTVCYYHEIETIGTNKDWCLN
jgi:hypothetical protein